MIEALSVATRRGEFTTTLAHYTHPPVLVIDEVGCAPRSTETPCGMRGPPVTVAAVT
jgi:DNA replication protein DnaC